MKERSSLIFTGDIGFDKYMDGRWNDENLIDPEILSFLHSGDHVIANVEGAMVRRESPTVQRTLGLQPCVPVQQLIHSMDPAAGKVLDRMHADIWNLCNNHICDAGEEGVRQTLEESRRHGAKTIGAGMNLDEAARPLILDEAGGIGIFSVGYRRGCKPAGEDHAGCLLWNDMDRIRQNIEEIRKTCRWCVIVSHGGEEFTSLPSPYTRERYHAFLRMGADIVVSHHPHVPMNYETVGDKVIFYSLGNFIFDTDYQRAQFNTDLGILVKLNFTEDSYEWEARGLRIERGIEHITAAGLPRIFANVGERDYELLAPLAAKMMVAAYKRQLIYLKPEEYQNASDEKWAENFADPKRAGRVPGEALDFRIICPLAEREQEKAWEKSTLTDVKQYICEQL